MNLNQQQASPNVPPGGVTIPVLQPPPIPPRTTSVMESTQGYNAWGGQRLQGYQTQGTIQPAGMFGTLDGYQSTASQAPLVPQHRETNAPRRPPPPQGFPAPTRPNAINIQRNRESSPLISLSPPSDTASGFPNPDNNVTFCMDLEGIDFSNSLSTAAGDSLKHLSASMEDLSPSTSKLYPDISAAFNDVRKEEKTQDAAKQNASYRMSMPVGYGWNPAFMQNSSNQVPSPCTGSSSSFQHPQLTGSLSVPSTPQTGYMPSTPGLGYQYVLPSAVTNPFFAQQYNPGASQSSIGHSHTPDSAQNSAVNPSVRNSTDSQTASVDIDKWLQSQQFPHLTQTSEEQGRSRRDSDLIHLGFDDILTNEEKEYFSLDYFDPLHKKGRTDTIYSKDGLPQYFFAKPPEEWESETAASADSWVMFEDQSSKPSSARTSGDSSQFTDTSEAKTEDSTAVKEISPKSSIHEKLRPKLFVDEESDAFCHMVAELKSKYKSVDQKNNLGFIVSPMCDKRQDPISVKIVVYSDFSEEPFSFTSDVYSQVEHVISQVLYSCLHPAIPSHMIQVLKTIDFIFKVYDRSEYLLNEFPLCQYEYTHDCLKMDKDLCFTLMRRQDVALPFLRTTDDDAQPLYFPQDHIRESDVSRDSLEVLMDTFYKEVEKISDQVLKDEVDKVYFQSLSQSVKAICSTLSKIETIDISKMLQRVESTIKQLKERSPNKRSLDSSGGYATLPRTNVEARVSLVPELEEALESLVMAVKQLIKIYCQAFHTDFHLGSSIHVPWDPQDVTSFNENFIVHIATVHRVPTDWSGRYDEYKVVCNLYHGKRRLSVDKSTTFASLCTSDLVQLIVWDEWLAFDELPLRDLPRETRLCLTLWGLKYVASANNASPESQKVPTALGGVTIQIFSRKGYMLQGSQLVPLQMNTVADPTTPFCSTLQTDSALLQVNLPDFGKQAMFPEPIKVVESKKMTLNDLAPDLQDTVKDIIKKDCSQSCTADELEILWSYRNYLCDIPKLLPWILQGPHSWDTAQLPHIYGLLKQWTNLQPMQALELLLPQYPDLRVREFAVDCLRKMATDDLIDFIPQLIQALKFESYHSSSLAELLLEQSCKSVRFAHQFFWLLKGATQEVLYKRRYELMFVALISVAGESLYQEFRKQEEIVKTVSYIGEKVFNQKDKDGVLKREIQGLYTKFQVKGSMLLPHNPGFEVSGIDMKSCSYFTSNAFPLKLAFNNINPVAGPVYAMFKVGDDLRQDMLTMQTIRIMDRLWLKEGLDLKMITFSCLPTGPKRGFVELITESETLRKIQVSAGVTGSFKDKPIKDWLMRHNPTELEYKKAVDNFTCSCAGYCVATYVLGVCDRHNDNIMLKQTGHMFHIDFNKFLGDAQMFGNFKRDRVKFVLTSDMAYVINDGERPSDRFQHFVDICCKAFNILRKHANLFINLFSLMVRSGIPGITEKSIEFVQKALLPGLTDIQASADFTRMIEESLSAKSTQINFFIHNLAQMKFSSHQEGALLSFVPKTYSWQTDGRIRHVEVCGLQKRYQPEKHYIYILKIERESQKVPSYIFRLFAEFVEFRNKLVSLFPLVNWPQLPGRVILGRSHVKAVAENRKTEIEKFLKEIWHTAKEVCQCDLVYTFFHPLLRDEQEAHKEKLALPKLKENPVQLVRRINNCQVKLSLEFSKDTLHVMIMHAKDLPAGNELPSPYVKTYLLPDPEKITKRKTKIIKNTTHPTYNELIEYKLSQENLMKRILQVTVWDHDVLKENNLLGCVYIRLCDVNFTKENTQWYQLADHIQITDSRTLS